MGHLAVQDFLNHADTDTTLAWHLQSNHYPSIYSKAVVKACKKAIKNAKRNQWSKLVRWEEIRFHPREVVRENNRLYVATHKLVSLCHLDAFLNQQDEEE